METIEETVKTSSDASDGNAPKSFSTAEFFENFKMISEDEVKSLYLHGDDISKETALRYCSDFLEGSWTTLTVEDFNIQVLQGGYVNRIFTCENKLATGDEPKKVILRLYGGKIELRQHIFRNGGILEEVLVFNKMSECGLGPKLYGVFAEGRVEQYLPGRLLNNDDLTNPLMTATFARKLARFHQVKVPINKRPTSIANKIDVLIPFVEGLAKELTPRPVPIDFKGEFHWLMNVFPKLKTRTVLVHGDMNRANCLIRSDKEDPFDKVVLLDYEFSAYGYRGQDIGLHFANRSMDPTNVKGNFQSGLDYPTEDERRHVINAYNGEIKKMGVYELDESDNGLDNEDNMLMEAEYYVLLFTLFFALTLIDDRNKKGGMSTLFHIDDVNKLFGMLMGMNMKHQEQKNNFIERFGSRLK